MTRRGIALSLAFLATAVLAQEKATTESGKLVVLNPDGTWKYAAEPVSTPSPSDSSFVRASSATEEARLNRTGYRLFFDPNKWRQTGDDLGRASFEHKAGDGYALAISERIGVPLERLPEIALSNAKSAAPDTTVTLQESRVVNGTKVLVLQMRGTIQDIPFVYYGYYYSGKEGTVQLLTYTAVNLFEEYKADFEQFLNGFVVDVPPGG